MVSRAWVSRPLIVCLTARSAMFMSGETEVIVPLTMVPVKRLRLVFVVIH